MPEQAKEDRPAPPAERAAQQVGRVGRQLREGDGETVLHTVQGLARRQPWLVGGIALVAGLAGARLLKASRSSRRGLPLVWER